MEDKILVPVCRCNNCMRYFHEDVPECPTCKTDGYLMDTPVLEHSEELLDIVAWVEIELQYKKDPTQEEKNVLANVRRILSKTRK